MDVIEIKTLVDITNTNVTRLTQGSQLALDQNRNFNTLRQCLELRSIIVYDTKPIVEKINLKDLGFGSAYKGSHYVWTFTFSPDRADAYLDSLGSKSGFLDNDLHAVPVIINLSETINIRKAIFDCKDSQYKNIIIQAI
jgi:hypothetical protein